MRPHLQIGHVLLFELGGVGNAKVNAAAEKFTWVLRHPKVDIDDPVFWLAALLIADDIKLAEDGHGSFIEMLTTQRTVCLRLLQLSQMRGPERLLLQCQL